MPAETRHGPVRHWRIHLGAHKTATTHLQETLTLVRPTLAARGLDYIPNQLVRGRRLAVDAVAAAADRPAADHRPGADARGDRGDARAAAASGRRPWCSPRRTSSACRDQILDPGLLPAAPPERGAAREPRAAGRARALPVDPQLRHAAALGLCRDAEARPRAAGRLRGGPGAAARRAAELVRPRRPDPRRGAGGAAAASGGRRTTAPTPRRSWRRSAAARSGCCRRSPTRPGPARPRPTAIARPRRCRPDLPRAERSRRVRELFAGPATATASGRSPPPSGAAARRLRGRPRPHRPGLPDVLMRFAPGELAA